MEVISVLEKLAKIVDIDNTYLVGGYVRDFFLQTLSDNSLNLDLVTEMDFETLKNSLKLAKLNHSIYEKMLSFKIEIDGTIVDLVRARKEYYKAPGVISYTEPSTIREDVARRDFSVNALLIRVKEFINKSFYPIDLVNGYQDLLERKLRTLKHDSFIEDPSRLIRLVRYAARLKFNVDAATFQEYENCVESGGVFTSRSSRIILEIKRLFDESPTVIILDTIRRLGLSAPCRLLSIEFLEKNSNCYSSSQVFQNYFEQNKAEAMEFFEHFGCSIKNYL